jgi:branched-chain amino acid transport system ATP-binding protein
MNAAAHTTLEKTVLRTEHLTRAFGSLVVTNNVNLTVEPGERHVIIGPNGAGKTSLINQIGGQLAPSSGRIFVKGTDVTGWPPNRVSRLGVARTFQRNNLFQNLSVIENLRLAVEARRGRPLDFLTPVARGGGLIGRAEELMQRVHLTGGGARLARNLSYGEQRQLEIGLALAGEPDLLLLDEPNAGVDHASQEAIAETLGGRADAGASVVVVLHELGPFAPLIDRVVALREGRVTYDGPPEQLVDGGGHGHHHDDPEPGWAARLHAPLERGH